MPAITKKTLISLLALYLYFLSASFGLFHSGFILAKSAQNLKTNQVKLSQTQFQQLAAGEEEYKTSLKEIAVNTQPTAIAVPQLSLSLPVELGVYNNKNATWSISDKAAYYAQPTSRLTNTGGQTVLYAHNKNNLFGKIKQLNPGGIVVITDDKNQQWIYTLQSSKKVSPANTEVMYETPASPKLVLITCDGLFDEYRKLLYFDLIEPKSV